MKYRVTIEYCYKAKHLHPKTHKTIIVKGSKTHIFSSRDDAIKLVKTMNDMYGLASHWISNDTFEGGIGSGLK